VPRALVAHPDVRKVSFTGAMSAIVAVSKTAADNFAPLSLRLGGKNACTVFEDADVNLADRKSLDGGGSSTKRKSILLRQESWCRLGCITFLSQGWREL
jgi:acyl-CoA reductase-like NAD-dependent aldehyde dehydrogenase